MKQPFSGDFLEAVAFEYSFRKQNPSLAQRLGLPVDKGACEVWVDEFNAKRCLANGWNAWVVEDSGLMPNLAEKKTRGLGAVVVAGLGKAKVAISAYSAMFGSVGPVPKDQAEKRAAVCVQCPQNDTTTSILSFFTQKAATEIMGILGILKDLDLKTSKNEKLGICKGCGCPMKAKVFTPISVLKERMPAADWNGLSKDNPKCWILAETGK